MEQRFVLAEPSQIESSFTDQSFNPEPKVYVPNRFALVASDQCLMFLYLNFFVQNWQIVLVDGRHTTVKCGNWAMVPVGLAPS